MKFESVNNETISNRLTDEEVSSTLADEEREQTKCSRLVGFIHSHQPHSKPASQEEKNKALELAVVLEKWTGKKSASYEEIVVKQYVISMMMNDECPIKRTIDRAKDRESKRANHRPPLDFKVLCETYVIAKDHNITAAAKHFGIAPKTVRDRLNTFTAKVNRMFQPLLAEPLLDYKDLLQLDDEAGEASITQILRGCSGILFKGEK